MRVLHCSSVCCTHWTPGGKCPLRLVTGLQSQSPVSFSSGSYYTPAPQYPRHRRPSTEDPGRYQTYSVFDCSCLGRGRDTPYSAPVQTQGRSGPTRVPGRGGTSRCNTPRTVAHFVSKGRTHTFNDMYVQGTLCPERQIVHAGYHLSTGTVTTSVWCRVSRSSVVPISRVLRMDIWASFKNLISTNFRRYGQRGVRGPSAGRLVSCLCRPLAPVEGGCGLRSSLVCRVALTGCRNKKFIFGSNNRLVSEFHAVRQKCRTTRNFGVKFLSSNILVCVGLFTGNGDSEGRRGCASGADS